MEEVVRNNKYFKIIPENGTVYGIAIKKDFTNEVDSTFTDAEFDCLPIYMLEQVPDLNRANAVCDIGDKFDPKIGMDIAAAKLDAKDHEQFAKRCERAARSMESAIKKLDDLANKHTKKAQAIRDDLENYYVGGKYIR